MTWSNQPPSTGPAAAAPAVQGPLEWNVTEQVLNMYTSANYGLLIRDSAENGVGDEQTFNSREKATDGPPELVLAFDDSTPETTIVSGPDSPTDSTEATFHFTSDRADATFECSLDGAPFKTCSSPHHVAGLAEGDHTLDVRSTRKVRAVDPTPARYAWGIAIPPETTIDGPASPSDSAIATLTFASDDPEATFECARGGQPFASCTSPLALSQLPDGPQEVRVRAIDPFGNADPTPAEHAWIVAVPPEVAIVRAPADPSSDPAPGFDFTAADNGPGPLVFECRLDGGAWVACASPHGVGPLGDGRRAFDVRAIDAAGNISDAASHAWAVDTVAPVVTIDGPPDPTGDTSASFTIATDEPAMLECALDDGGFGECAPEYVDLADGEHTFRVRATDAAGNDADAEHSWTVDTVAPAIAIEGPPDPTNSTSATFKVEADEAAELECALDTDAFGACAAEYADLGDGRHTLHVRATDAASNQGTASYSWTVDTVAPTLTLDGPPDPTNRTSAGFTFAASEPAGFECALDDADFGECAAEYADLADGSHTFRVRATDAAGNHATASYAWTVDTVAPAVTIDGPADPTNSTTAEFSFTADEAATFECALDSDVFGECAPEYAGLADGRHTFYVRLVDAAGNEATASYAWTVDTVAPTATIDGPADPTRSTEAAFTVATSEPAALVCALDTAELGDCALEYADLADGGHTFYVRATDAAGNEAIASYSWTVDTVAPTLTIDGPRDPSNSGTAAFAIGTGEPATLECALDDATFGECAPDYADLGDGRHALRVRATDAAGNEATALHAWTIDTVAPLLTVAGPPDPTHRTTAELTFSADESATFECALDSDAFGDCATAYADVADGRHTFFVRGTDAAGNHSVASYSWTVDTIAPTVTIDGPADPTNSPNARFAFTASEPTTFECALDDATFGDCAAEYADLSDGHRTFRVRATDAAGNTASASYSWTIDSVAPTITIDGPADPSNRSTAAFGITTDEPADLECALDDAPLGECAPEYTGVADGRHSFAVRAIDAAGNEGTASYSWTVDTGAPTVTVDGPADPTNSTTATFDYTADQAATFECALDTAAFGECAGEYADLGDGRHTFYVRATDATGNEATASHSWTVDTIAPAVTISDRPADPTVASSARFGFASPEPSTFECSLDGGVWTECESPAEYGGLGVGEHAFQVRATDAADNRGEPATYAWTIAPGHNPQPPETTITARPADPSNSSSASFAFTATSEGQPSQMTFECSLDGVAFAACSSPRAYTGLGDGAHTFSVRATDFAGNVDATPATYAWAVDTTAPQTTITAAPPATTSSTGATFGFTSEPGTNFECSLDGAAFTACDSPRTYTGLADGSHTLGVRARDAAGNADPTPATHSWTVDTTAPQTTITSAPPSPTNGTSASFAFSAGEPGAAFECSLDGAAFAACTSPRAYSGLANGAHTFGVRARDAAGNADPTPATHGWSVDTSAPQTTITSAPPATSSSNSASFAFTASETGSAFECSLDGAAFAACTSPRAYSGLANGAHIFSVRARDAAGNTDATPATHSWTVAVVQGCGPAVTATAAADAWIDENSPSNNKGTDSILKVQSKGPRDNFRALVRFTLPAVPAGCVIESATLRLFAASAKTGRTLHALRVNGPWTENQVNWTNQPATTGTAAATASGQGYREWSVTAHVQEMYAGANNGFLIRDAVEGQDSEQQFHAREKGESPPQLVVRFATQP